MRINTESIMRRYKLTQSVGAISRRDVVAGASAGVLAFGVSARGSGGCPSVAPPQSHLADQLEIKRLVYRYAIALDNLDVSSLSECLAPKTTVESGGLTYDRNVAAELIRVAREDRGSQSRYTLHFILNHWYEIKGDSAKGVTYGIISNVSGSEGKWTGTETHVRYDDDVIKRRGQWQFLYRRCELLGAMQGPATVFADLQARG